MLQKTWGEDKMKKKVLTDIKITCDEPSYTGIWYRSIEDRARALEAWVKDFHDFIRDHRSQDPVHLYVEREYKDQCSFCGYEWEVDEVGTPLCCDKAITEWTEGMLSNFVNTIHGGSNAKNIG